MHPLIADQAVRDFPIVRRALARILHIPALLERADLFQAGVIGLLQAAERYDPVWDCSFKTYAGYRVEGAMRDTIRGGDPLSSHARRRVQKNEGVQRDLEQRLRRPAAQVELAAALGMTAERLRVFQVSTSGELPPPEPSRSLLETLADRGWLERRLSRLPRVQQQILRMELSGLRPVEIARELGCTEGNVCHHRRSAFATLRA